MSYLSYRVPFADTDLMGIVHHSNYINFFERGRVEFLRQSGVYYSDLVRENVHFPVLRVSCTYRRPLTFDDNVLIESRIQGLSKSRLEFSYRILKKSTPETPDPISPSFFQNEPLELGYELATIGHSEHCCLGLDFRPMRIPDYLEAKLAKYFTEAPKT